MIKTVEAYEVHCDKCDTRFEEGDFTIFEDSGVAVETAIDSFDWVENPELGTLYCPTCPTCDKCAHSGTARWEEEFAAILCPECFDEVLERRQEAEDQADEAANKMGDGN